MFKIIRPASVHEIPVTETIRTDSDTMRIQRTKGNRHKYWYCQCIRCQRIHIIRSDEIYRKKCNHQKTKLKENKMTINYKDKMFGTLRVKRVATLADIKEYKPKLITSTEVGRGTRAIRRTSGSRHKYWYCVCAACQAVRVTRSNKLAVRRCVCQRGR